MIVVMLVELLRAGVISITSAPRCGCSRTEVTNPNEPMAVRTYSNVFTAQEIASITGGELSCPSDVTVTGQVTIDSRTVSTGDLFVAVVGERSDGHDYACVAHSQGAVLVLSQKNIKGFPVWLSLTPNAPSVIWHEHTLPDCGRRGISASSE